MKRSTKWIFTVVTCAALTAGAHEKNAPHVNHSNKQSKRYSTQQNQQYSEVATPVVNKQDIARGGQASRVDMEQDQYAPVFKTKQDIVNNVPAPTFEDGSSASLTNPSATTWENENFEEGSSAAAGGTTNSAAAGGTSNAAAAGGMAAASTAAAPAGEMNDEQIAHILKTANDAEIDAAQLAKRRAENDQVKEFAKTMIDDHKNNNKEGRKVLKGADIGTDKNEMSKALKKDAKAKMDDMKKLKGREFDRAYMDNQVAMHTQLLADLDQKFIPAAKKPELKQFLQTTRGHVQHHLTRAQEIVKTLPAVQ